MEISLPAREDNPTPLAQLDPDILYSPEELAEPAAALVAKMSLEEAASLCSGRNFWQLKSIPRLGLESVSVADGPHGLRCQENEADHLGMGASLPATCFPTAVTLAATWDVGLLQEVGQRIGAEAAARGVSVVLGPGVNIKRSPLCGRNFEYFSEDPHLSAELAAAWIEGVQSRGVGASLKHFVANEQEWQRMVVDTLVDERTLREIYLAAFEPAVRRARPWTIMAAYNRLLGVYCCEHEWLLGRVLRDEWGYGGLVVSDWLGTSERVRACERGLDLEMPGLNKGRDAKLVAAVQEGRIPHQAVRTAAARVTALILASQHNRRGKRLDPTGAALAQLLSDNHAAARRVAREGAVLLKNEVAVLGEGSVLPLRASSSVAVLGAFAERPRYQGAGSSSINASQCEAPLAAIRAAVEAAGGSVSYAPGYEPLLAGADAALRDEAVAVARAAESVVLICGLPSSCESEGFDRTHLGLPQQMVELIEAVAAVAPRLVVVLLNGSPVEMPWVDRVPAVLAMGLGGQAMGGAMADLAFGAACPCGKLAETLPHKLDGAEHPHFASHPRQVVYREGLNVGYRQYRDEDLRPSNGGIGVPAPSHWLFPFGHGLTYTSFEYSELSLSARTLDSRDSLELRLTLRNSGAVSGAEVVQVYVRPLSSSVHRPDRELRAFTKKHLAPAEQTALSFALPPRAFAYYDTLASDWYAEPGEYEVLIGASCVDIRLRAHLTLTGPSRSEVGGAAVEAGYRTLDDAMLAKLGLEVPPAEGPRPYSENTTWGELGQSGWLGWLIFSIALSAARREAYKNAAPKPGADPLATAALGDAATMAKISQESLRGLPLRGMYNLGMISDKALQAVVLWLNGRYCAAAATAVAGAAALLGRAPSPAAAPAASNKGRPSRQHSRLYSPPGSPQARPLNS